VTELSNEQQQHFFGWGTDIFGVESYQLQWRPKNWHLLLSIDDQLVSHVGMLTHTVSAGEHSVRVGGIGGVVSLPIVQRKGFARHALQSAIEFLDREQHVTFGLLFCRATLAPWYSRLGWQPVTAPVVVDQPSEKVLSPLVTMVYPCRDQIWPPGALVLGSFPW
jgi:predicted GNAT family N-acyltransferase